MMNPKKITGTTFVLTIAVVLSASAQVQQADNLILKQKEHPRIFWLAKEEEKVKYNIEHDTIWNKIHQSILQECNKIVNLPAVEEIKIGHRLLDKSRTCLHRVFYLSYAYRITRDQKYLKRAEKEMLAVAAFRDWNPGHFLDVAEMTTALAIGYDWLYHDLSQDARTIIRNAILQKGIEPSIDEKPNWWIKGNSNWNQVCNTGMTLGALAIYEDHEKIAKEIISRAIKSIELPMSEYAPDGAYPEGYSYWSYGTTYNVMFFNALETAFDSDFDILSKQPWFLKTPSYLQHMSGPSNLAFNYSDCGPGTEFNPAMMWFANRTHDLSLLWIDKQKLARSTSFQNRFLPTALLWGQHVSLAKIAAPQKLMWVGAGVNPVALFRTSWTTPDAIFVGFKAGSPGVNHGHMDVGSFVMETNGIRWAMDLGMQDYTSLETEGIALWDMKQNSSRWKVFRYNNLAHNTLAIDNEYQLVSGKATIESHSENQAFMNAVSDLTEVYKSKVAKLRRGIAIVDHQYVLIRDEITTNADAITLRWSMVTPASMKIINPTTAELTKDGKTLFMQVRESKNISIKTWSTNPTTKYDAPNPGTVIVGYEVKIPAHSKKSIVVILNTNNRERRFKKAKLSLSEWPKD